SFPSYSLTTLGSKKPGQVNIVGPIHPKAMPVILTKSDEIETWLTAPAEQALRLQRLLGEGVLKIVARGVKKDGD
ncbi:MAG: hypothetical protein PSV22_03785, partial [Pseudolabrys sp.]|nr:hypothetical protein [Pseudolabrys sp.]